MGPIRPDSLQRTGILILLVIASMLAAYPSVAQVEQTADDGKIDSGPVPGLADLMPEASSLFTRLAVLESSVKDLPNLSELERNLSMIDSSLAGPAGEIARIKSADHFRYSRLQELREEVTRLGGDLEDSGKPLRDAIRLMDNHRNEWFEERRRWQFWQSASENDLKIEQIDALFEEVNRTIDDALAIIHSGLIPMLEVQGKGERIRERITGLTLELEIMLESRRHIALIESSPMILTSEYLAQLSSASAGAFQNLRRDFSLPGGIFLGQYGWVFVLQILSSLLLIIILRRNRRKLGASERWKFLAHRSFSAAIFFVSISTILIYALGGAPGILKYANIIVAAVTFVRISSAFVGEAWKKEACVAIMTAWVLVSSTDIFWVPSPLFRMFTILISLFGLLLTFRWAAERRRRGAQPLSTYLLYLCAIFFAFILTAEIRGTGSLPTYLLNSFMRTIAIVIIFTLFLYIIHGGIEWLFKRGSVWQSPLLKNVDTDNLIRRTRYFIDFTVYGLILIPGILMVWGVFGSLPQSISGVLSLGFDIGARHISVRLLIVAAGIMYGTFLVSWIVQKSLMEGILTRYKTEIGVRHSIARLVHYLIVFIGFLIIISVLGVDITKLTIVISALGVGIGFGLQGIVNNFVSGLILLFERPVRVGDYIEVGGRWLEVREIGIRSTRVYTFDKADVIIPNADLISNQVTIWTLSNRLARLIIKVGVAYGSDVELVMKKLLACAETNEKISGSPPPRVLFIEFGEVALNFELWAYVLDASTRFQVISELNQEISRSFREAGIEIAFPQLDLHLRSIDESAVMRVRGSDDGVEDDGG